jgi:hypothetical protein
MFSRGRQKKSTDPPVHLLNPRPTHPPADCFFSLTFVLVRFRAFFGKGSSKIILFSFKKPHVETFFLKLDSHLGVSFSSIFLGIFAFSGVSQRWEFKNTTKNVLQNNCVENKLLKPTSNLKPICFSNLLYHVFRRFSVRAVRKHSGLFLASDPPTHHGGHRLFLPAFGIFFFLLVLNFWAFRRGPQKHDLKSLLKSLCRKTFTK